MLVIASDKRWAPGDRVSGQVSDINYEWHSMVFIVVRECTREEYIDSAIANGASEADAKLPFEEPVRYFQIHTD